MTGVVYWPARDLMLRVVGDTTGYEGEARLHVCKTTATLPHGLFSVRAADVVPFRAAPVAARAKELRRIASIAHWSIAEEYFDMARSSEAEG